MRKVNRMSDKPWKKLMCTVAVLFFVIVASTAVAGDSYEPDNSRSSAKPIEIGTIQNRTIDPAGDVDWISFLPPSRPATYKVIIFADGLALNGQVWVKLGKLPEVKVNPRIVIKKGKRLAATIRSPGNIVRVKVGLWGASRTSTGKYRVLLKEIIYPNNSN